MYTRSFNPLGGCTVATPGPAHARLPCAHKVLAKLQRDFVTQAITGKGRKNPLDLPARSTPLNLNFLAEKSALKI